MAASSDSVEPEELELVAQHFKSFLEKHEMKSTLETFTEEWALFLDKLLASKKPTVSASTGAREESQAQTTPKGQARQPHDDKRLAESSGSESLAKSAEAHTNASAPLESVEREASGTPPTTTDGPWDAKEMGVIMAVGDADELWDCDDFSSPRAPSYPMGGGIRMEEFAELKEKKVEYVPSKPYMKEAFPPNLPLESVDLRVIFEAGKTGFEEAKEYPIVVGETIAGRYQIQEFLGSAAFSRAVQCIDLKWGHQVCIKIIRNSKDFFDQSLDEVKLLQLINNGADADDVHVLQLYDFFYYKEHMFLVCELLRDNLYEFAKYNREHEEEAYFTMPRVQKIAKQVLEALAYIHSLNLIHCDLKPENILIKSFSRCEVKVIDFGSSCFTSDHLSSYIQSRCYRAPEVVIGCHYDGRIDVWSLGCILPELISGLVLFQNNTLPQMMARIAAICGPFPAKMLHGGRHTCRFFTQHGVAFEQGKESNDLSFYFPKTTTLKQQMPVKDELFYDFVSKCLTVDPEERPTAKALLSHPFILHDYQAAGAPAAPTTTS